MNRFTRSVGAPNAYRPKGAIAEGLDQIDRSGRTADSEALFAVGNQLAGIFGNLADEQAKIEGDRAGKIAGNEPGYRPEGSTTIRGRAFERAATSTYADNLDAKMRRVVMETFTANKDNPVALKEALDKQQQDLLQADAFPEIQGAVRASFERLRIPFEVRAADALTEKQNDEARAARVERDAVSAGFRANSVQLAPRDQNAQQAVQDDLRQQRQADEQEVRAGRMTAEDASRRHLDRQRDVRVRQAVAVVDQIGTVDELDRVQNEFQQQRQSKKDPIDQDVKVMDAVDLALDRRRQKLLTEGRRVTVLTDKTAEDMISRAEQGTPPPPEEIAQLKAQAQTPEQQAVVARFERRLEAVRLLNTRGPDAIDAIARQVRQSATPLTKGQADDVQFLEDMAARRRAEISKDPVKVVRQSGLAPVEALNVGDPALLAEGIRKRVAVGRATEGASNPGGRALEANDISAIRSKIGEGGETGVTTLRAVAQGAGRDAPRLFKEIGGDAPELAQAGLLLTNGREKAAREVLAGVALRNVDGGAKAREVDGQTFQRTWVATVGASLADNPQDASRIRQTAATIAMYRLRNAADLKDTAAQTVYREAIQEAMGRETRNGVTFGGVARVKPGWWRDYPVAAPPEVRTDRFKDAIDAVRDEDLAKQPVPPVAGTTARQIRQAIPVAVPGGYRFATGEPDGPDPKFILGRDGQPFVLRWDDIKSDLRVRAPGAFEGGQ
jgi:hypothetical protein